MGPGAADTFSVGHVVEETSQDLEGDAVLSPLIIQTGLVEDVT